jgi:hypothetical protein
MTFGTTLLFKRLGREWEDDIEI